VSSHSRRVAVTCLLLAAAVWVFLAKASRRMPDFEVYWRAGARASAAEPLYRPSDAPYEFKYFPAFAVLTTPFGALPLATAKPLWFALSTAALIALLPLSVRLLPNRRASATILISGLLIGLGKYYAEDLVLGQINTLVALVATGALLAFAARREALGGALIALAVVLKPYTLILVPWVAARRQRRSIVAVAAGLVVACALPILFYGLDATIVLHRDWWRTVSTTTQGTLLDTRNISLASMWAKWLGIGSGAAWLATASSVALLTAGAVVFLKRRHVARPDTLEAGLLLAITPMISPQGWDYVMVLATTAMVCVLNDIDRLPRFWRLLALAAIGVIGLTLYDLLGRRLFYAALTLCVITLGATALIASVVALRLRRLA
jgi:hypothetical protein